MTTTTFTGSNPSRLALDGIPQIDFPANLEAALATGRRMTSILAEVIALRRGAGRLAPAEYFYFRLWDPRLTPPQKRQFVGKLAQEPMHLASNSLLWHAAAEDKLLLHTLLTGAGIRHPDLLAITQPARLVPGAITLDGAEEIAAFLRDPARFPLFAKPIDGKYSLAVLSADRYDATTDQVILQGAPAAASDILARDIAAHPAGYLLQRRLTAHPSLAERFGARLWSVRVIVLLTPAGPIIHRAVAKIATGNNPADNFWRPGNMLGAIDLASGQISRVVQGTGRDMVVDGPHPDTGLTITGTLIPDWPDLQRLVTHAARLLPAIRTQAWDIALTDSGPVPLEVNFGGDLNLPQLAYGQGALDDVYRAHLTACGYRF